MNVIYTDRKKHVKQQVLLYRQFMASVAKTAKDPDTFRTPDPITDEE